MESALEYLRSTFLATPTASTIASYLTYYAYICLASILVPSRKVKGHPQPKRGPQLTYTINGFRLTILTILIVVLFGGVLPALKSFQLFAVANLAKDFWPLWSTVNIVAILVSTLLYLKGKLGISILGEGVDDHSHGSFGLDFWVGRELNPKIGNFDIKFVAYRVAMIFWLVLNLSFLALQWERVGSITGRMWAYQLATGIYVLDYFWNEEKMLTTWDIISE
jgi:Delta14-sterol reductase